MRKSIVNNIQRVFNWINEITPVGNLNIEECLSSKLGIQTLKKELKRQYRILDSKKVGKISGNVYIIQEKILNSIELLELL